MGAALTVIITLSVEGVQGEFEIVHLNVFAPTPKTVSPEVGEFGVVIVPVPEINVHNPVPTPGAFPAKVVEVALQVKFWSGPALAVVGEAINVIARELAALVPQLLVAVTEILPEEAPKFTRMFVVPCPLVIVEPAGAAQV